jgi:hypothetical protein
VCFHQFKRRDQSVTDSQCKRHEILVLTLFDQGLDLNDSEVHDRLLLVTTSIECVENSIARRLSLLNGEAEAMRYCFIDKNRTRQCISNPLDVAVLKTSKISSPSIVDEQRRTPTR